MTQTVEVQAASGRPWREWILPALSTVALFLALYAPAGSAGFVLVDDHVIIETDPREPAHPQTAKRSDLWRIISRDEPGQGRFRPLDWALRFCLVRALGLNPTAWHVTMIAMGMATALLLFAAARTFGLAAWASLLLAWQVTLLPMPAQLWVRLDLGDARGMLVLAVALLAMAKAARRERGGGWDVLFFLCVVAMSLIKESFIFVLPALLAARLMAWKFAQDRSWAETLRRHRGLTAATLAVFAVALSIASWTVLRAGKESYGGWSLDYGGAVGEALRVTARTLFRQALGFLPVLVLAGCALWKRARRRFWCWMGLTAGLALFWVLPQVAIHAGRGGLWGRYIIPAAVILAAVNALAWDALRRRGWRYAYWATGAAMLLALVPMMRTTQGYALAFRSQSRALAMMETYLRDHLPRDSSVVILYDNPLYLSESAYSLITMMGHAGRRDLTFYPVCLPQETPYSKLEQAVAGGVDAVAPRNHPFQLEQTSAVVLLTSPVRLAGKWERLASVPWERRSFSVSWPVISFRQRKLLKETFGYEVWLRPSRPASMPGGAAAGG